MKYKKSLIMLALVILLVFIASVNASDVNDASLISEDANQIELSTNNEITEDNLNANEENTQLQSNYDETVSVENELDILSENEGTYTDLKNEIGNGGNINLTKTYYHYDSSTTTIEITSSGVIDGKGAVIDMAGSTIQAFKVTATGVTIKNLTIKNTNYNSDGGAIHFLSFGIVSNCNFVNNSAYQGGAIYFFAEGAVTNCNFVNNSANCGGAIYFKDNGEVTNCNFVNNSARRGGAVYCDVECTATNCNFTNNYGYDYGGAVYCYVEGTATNCNFDDNFAGVNGGAIISYGEGTVANCNFIKNTAFYDGGAVYFYRKSEVINCNFTDNNANWNGGAVLISSGGVDVTNSNFINNSAVKGGALFLSGSPTTVINSNFTNNKVTGPDCMGGAVYDMGNIELRNCIFTNNSATGDGGASYYGGITIMTNCNFTDNFANNGGAIFLKDTVVFTNCNFVNNTASAYGGAVVSQSIANMTNCNFIGNNAFAGSAIFFNDFKTKIISNSCFLNNRANGEGLQVTKNDNNITIIFTGNNNFLNAIYSEDEISFTNVTYWGANGIANTGSSTTLLSSSNREVGQNITVNVVVNNIIVLNEVKVTDENGLIVLDISAGENYYIRVHHDTDSYYTKVETTLSNMTFNVNVTSQTTHNRTVNITAKSNIFSGVMKGKLLFILQNTNPITANYAGNGTWWIEYTFAEYGDYQVNATYEGLDNVTVKNATISISKTPTNINIVNETVNLFVTNSIGTGVTLTPADAGNLTFTSNNESVAKVVDGKIIAVSEGTAVITVSFAGNYDYEAAEDKTITVKVIKYDSKVIISPIADVVYPNNVTIKYSIENKTNVTVSIDGVSNDKILITNDTITVIGLDAGTYTITILNNESDLYYQSNDTKSFIVNKDTTSIDAADVSTIYNINKDLVITLKDSNGQILSGFNVTVDIKGAKTYTTDKNGQIKVTTKGLAPKTYTTKITFNGNTNYDNSSKNVKVTVKKATPKITAKKKTYKATTKTKKYSVVLKGNTGKAIKKAKVLLKVKGKTYKATTNSKGKATFKIKKLNKKGTFKATITYKGNKYYKKVMKKSKIKVIFIFKTVSRGSKDKSTVKEIQQALKDNGYYLSYKGHYLKVDGKYLSCTVRSVKEFQHDKELKVTGKVDEKTAKKLGII